MGNEQPRTSKTARYRAGACLLASLIAVATPPATAQNPLSSGGAQRSPGCLPRATRVRESCDPKQVVVRSEQEVVFSLELPPAQLVQCAATVEIAYTQRDSVVGVEGAIHNTVCGPSSGEFNVTVSIRGENRELKILEFLESWQRVDDQPVKFMGTYPIGEDAEVVRVRPVQLRCTCADVKARIP